MYFFFVQMPNKRQSIVDEAVLEFRRVQESDEPGVAAPLKPIKRRASSAAPRYEMFCPYMKVPYTKTTPPPPPPLLQETFDIGFSQNVL